MNIIATPLEVGIPEHRFDNMKGYSGINVIFLKRTPINPRCREVSFHMSRRGEQEFNELVDEALALQKPGYRLLRFNASLDDIETLVR